MDHSERHSRVVRKIPLCATALALLLPLPPTLAQARQSAVSMAAGTAPSAKKKSVKIKRQPPGSGETAAERDRRLLRECKGLPNAGACLGYARR